MAIFRGDIANGVVEGQIKINVKPLVGGTTERNFKGKEADIKAKAIELQALGYETTITSGKPAWELIATLPWDISQFTSEPDPVAVWEVKGHALERSILECTDRDLVSNLSSAVKASIEYKIKNPTSAEPLIETNADLPMFENAWLVYNLMRAGVESRQEWTIEVTRTITVSKAYSFNWSLANVGKVLSKGSLISVYNVPSQRQNSLPNSSSSITNVGTAADPIWVFFGYLEQYPTIQDVSNNKVQISQSWIYNKWSAGAKGLYDVV
jgi:hypothetical protein